MTPQALTFAAILALVPGAASLDGPAGEDAAKLVAEMDGVWSAKRTQVASGEFETRMFRFSDSDAKHLKRDQASRIIEEICDRDNFEKLDGMFDSLDTGDWSKGKSTLWGVPLFVTVEGTRVKNEIFKKAGREIRIFDGKDELAYNPANHQARIDGGRTNFEKMGIEHFCSTPPQALVDALSKLAKTGDLRATELVPGIWRLDGGGLRVEFERATGFVTERTQKDASGRASKQSRQHLASTTPDGVRIPKYVETIEYEGEFVRRATIYYIRSYKLNILTDDAAFKMPVPKNELIFDYRSNPKTPAVMRTAGPVDDAKSFMDEQIASSGGIKSYQDRKFTLMKLGLPILGLLAIWAVRRVFLRRRA